MFRELTTFAEAKHLPSRTAKTASDEIIPFSGAPLQKGEGLGARSTSPRQLRYLRNLRKSGLRFSRNAFFPSSASSVS